MPFSSKQEEFAKAFRMAYSQHVMVHGKPPKAMAVSNDMYKMIKSIGLEESFDADGLPFIMFKDTIIVNDGSSFGKRIAAVPR